MGILKFLQVTTSLWELKISQSTEYELVYINFSKVRMNKVFHFMRSKIYDSIDMILFTITYVNFNGQIDSELNISQTTTYAFLAYESFEIQQTTTNGLGLWGGKYFAIKCQRRKTKSLESSKICM